MLMFKCHGGIWGQMGGLKSICCWQDYRSSIPPACHFNTNMTSPSKVDNHITSTQIKDQPSKSKMFSLWQRQHYVRNGFYHFAKASFQNLIPKCKLILESSFNAIIILLAFFGIIEGTFFLVCYFICICSLEFRQLTFSYLINQLCIKIFCIKNIFIQNIFIHLVCLQLNVFSNVLLTVHLQLDEPGTLLLIS